MRLTDRIGITGRHQFGPISCDPSLDRTYGSPYGQMRVRGSAVCSWCGERWSTVLMVSNDAPDPQVLAFIRGAAAAALDETTCIRWHWVRRAYRWRPRWRWWWWVQSRKWWLEARIEEWNERRAGRRVPVEDLLDEEERDHES